MIIFTAHEFMASSFRSDTHFTSFSSACFHACMECGKFISEHEIEEKMISEVIETEAEAKAKWGRDASLFKLPTAFFSVDRLHFRVEPSDVHD